LKLLLLILLLVMAGCLAPFSVSAQTPDTSWKGSVKGIIWDSAHTIILRDATVAVYIAKDSTLLGYRLTNNYGEFSLKGLPVKTPLRIIVSFIGYDNKEAMTTLAETTDPKDLGHLSLTAHTSEMAEVVVKGLPPPVRMKGDTLEFNADAFRLDPNAQTEDLLRRLPGVTVWADGTITVNGRQVTDVLVNGKPFFGNDSRIAIQNVPKNIVDKIQVYQRNRDIDRPYDSTSEMNIKLKKGKDVGYFGKFSGGYGTGGHYESDGNLNLFDSRNQLGLAVTSNNVNKVANDMDFILRNSTFQGTGANVEYQSDFTVQGTNQFTAAAMNFQHDFIPNPDFYNNDRLSGSYFFRNDRQKIDQTTQSLTTLNDSSFYKQTGSSHFSSSQSNENADVKYNKKKDGHDFTLDGSFNNETLNSSIASNNSITDRQNTFLSQNDLASTTNRQNNEGQFSASYSRKPLNDENFWLSAYTLSYKASLADTWKNLFDQNDYTAADDSSQDQALSRQYHDHFTRTMQSLHVYLPEFGRLFFGDYHPLRFNTGLTADAALTTENENDHVADKDTTTNAYSPNDYLTNKQHDFIYDWRPGLTFNKTSAKSLSGRYSKSWTTSINLIEQLHELDSRGEKSIQQFTRRYQQFNPDISFNFSKNEFAEYADNMFIRLSSTSQYPTVQQIAPLTDNINPNFIQYGNSHLGSQTTRALSVTFSHASQRSNNIFSWQGSLDAGYSDDYLAGSSTIDSLGRTLYTLVNASGYRYLTLRAELKKAFRLQQQAGQLQLSLTPGMTINRTPGYVNQQLNDYDNTTLSIVPDIDYTFRDWLALDIKEKESYTRSTNQEGGSFPLVNSISRTEASLSVKVNHKLTLNTNVIYTRNTNTGMAAQTFTIWNASVACRIFRANTGEIKFSALDLLHQNQGLINAAANNTITQTAFNTLQQYFMITFAYMPRKFGK
jgi:hypothetical protein